MKVDADDIISALIHSVRPKGTERNHGGSRSCSLEPQIHTGFHSNASREYDSVWLHGEWNIDRLTMLINKALREDDRTTALRELLKGNAVDLKAGVEKLLEAE